MSDVMTAVQSSVALTPAGCPSAMKVSHDALISRFPTSRSGPVSWRLFGPASTTLVVSRAYGRPVAMAGDIFDGMAELTRLWDVCDDWAREDLAVFRQVVAGASNPVLVIAQVDVVV